jgi:hypothetical protein
VQAGYDQQMMTGPATVSTLAPDIDETALHLTGRIPLKCRLLLSHLDFRV